MVRERLARAVLFERLTLMRREAGYPSLREIADKARVALPGREPRIMSPWTVSQLFRVDPDFLPSWPFFRAVVVALGGDERELAQLWYAARGERFSLSPGVIQRCVFPGCVVARPGRRPMGYRGCVEQVDELGNVMFVDFWACSRAHAEGALGVALDAGGQE